MDLGSAEERGIIEDLYEGLGIDYICCLACKNVSSHETKFRDLGLTIQNPFNPDSPVHSTLLQALCTHLRPEKLEGENQFACGKCGKKQDALKGFQLVKLPRILCFNLNRFTLDYTTFTRVKLNDRLVFPPVLEMHELLSKSTKREQLSGEELAALEAKNPFVGIKYKYKRGV